MTEKKPVKDKKFTGNRGVEAEVTMSFMCSEKMHKRIKKAATVKDVAMSEFIRDAVNTQLMEVFGQ